MNLLRALLRLFLAALFAASVLAGPTGTSDPRIRVEWLRAEIARHDELYFRQAAPEITDAEYDALKRELAALLAAHPGLVPRAAPASGDDRSGRFPTHAHHELMRGLEKSYSQAELRKFLARVARAAGDGAAIFVVEPKYDGLAISLVYERGELRRAVTRGNGAEGDVVTENLLACADVPRRLPVLGGPDLVEIRGEVFMEHAEFERLNAERVAAGEPIHAHPRNLAAGTLKSTDPAVLRTRRLAFVCYGWGAWLPASGEPVSQRDLLGRLSAWGFSVPPTHVAPGPETVWQIVRAMDAGRINFPVPLDGAVVKVDEVALRRKLGESDEAPRWAIAHKFEPERVETRLRAITWQVGRTGMLTPVAELEPVKLGGTLVSRASLQNRREIERRDYRIGDTVRVEKAGEIIPQLVGVNLLFRADSSEPYVVPHVCPVCATVLAADEFVLRCPNRSCLAQVKRRMEHFAGDTSLDLRGFGPAVIAALVEQVGVRDPHELYHLGPEQWRQAAGGRPKVAEKLAEEVERSRQAELWRFIHALGLPGVGPATARRLARHCEDLGALRSASKETLIAAGVSAAVAEEIAEALQRPEMRALIDGLLSAGISPVRK